MRHSIIIIHNDEILSRLAVNGRYRRAQLFALQFDCRFVLEFDRLENAVYLVLRDTDVGFCNLNARVVQNLIQENKAFRAAVVRLIHIATECLSERMCREIAYLDFELALKLFQTPVDILDGERLSSDFAFEDVFILIRREQQVVHISDFPLNRPVEVEDSCLLCFLLNDGA